jgi:hypothetical protein
MNAHEDINFEEQKANITTHAASPSKDASRVRNTLIYTPPMNESEEKDIMDENDELDDIER